MHAHVVCLIILFIATVIILGQRNTINRLLKEKGFTSVDEAFPPAEEERDYEENPELPLRDFEVHLKNGTVVPLRAELHQVENGYWEFFKMRTGYCVGQFLVTDVAYWTAKVVAQDVCGGCDVQEPSV